MKVNPSAHSAYIAKWKGKVILSIPTSICYTDLFNFNEGKRYDEIKVFFGKHRIEDAIGPEEWCDWVINRSFVADAFITKDAKEGLENGFYVDPKCDRGIVESGMMILRRPFEDSSWPWYVFVKMGYTEVEAFALASNYSADEETNTLSCGVYNTGHMVIQPGCNYTLYEGKGYKPKDTPTFYEGKKDRLGGTSQMWGCRYWSESSYLSQKPIELTKENCDKLLQKLKGL